MTVEGNSKLYASTTANATVNVAADFQGINIGGIKQNDHVGFWVTNMDTTAANIIWFRLDATAATVGGDDCYPLRPGERCYIRKTDVINYIAAAATPGFWVGGDQSAIVYS